jgi:hypothetical protein
MDQQLPFAIWASAKGLLLYLTNYGNFIENWHKILEPIKPRMHKKEQNFA